MTLANDPLDANAFKDAFLQAQKDNAALFTDADAEGGEDEADEDDDEEEEDKKKEGETEA